MPTTNKHLVCRAEPRDVLATQSRNVIMLQETSEINSPGENVSPTGITCNLQKLHAVKDQYTIWSMSHRSSPVSPEAKQGLIRVSMPVWSCLARLMSASSSAPAKDTVKGNQLAKIQPRFSLGI